MAKLQTAAAITPFYRKAGEGDTSAWAMKKEESNGNIRNRFIGNHSDRRSFGRVANQRRETMSSFEERFGHLTVEQVLELNAAAKRTCEEDS